MRPRRLGGLALYLAPAGPCRLRLADQPWCSRDIAVVPPYQTHQVTVPGNDVIGVLIEPESVSPAVIASLMTLGDDPGWRGALIARLRGAAARLHAAAPDGDIAAAEFDRLALGHDLTGRGLDPRIAQVIGLLAGDDPEHPTLASDLARAVGLSTSRLLHLFKEQTGVSFRDYRVWRRARSFLMHANNDSSLTDVALSLGYPDSSHFSHSIRKTYGLKPRSIRVGSQNLHVTSSPGMAATPPG
jgi:AraC-like DNA-binding protein